MVPFSSIAIKGIRNIPSFKDLKKIPHLKGKVKRPTL